MFFRLMLLSLAYLSNDWWLVELIARAVGLVGVVGTIVVSSMQVVVIPNIPWTIIILLETILPIVVTIPVTIPYVIIPSVMFGTVTIISIAAVTILTIITPNMIRCVIIIVTIILVFTITIPNTFLCVIISVISM